MREKFDEKLNQLFNSLIEMGALVEKSISDASAALVGQDVELARKIIASDDEIDEKEREVEGLCLKLILQQQPVAGDLRLISAVLKIITDLERIGDQASDIARITLRLAGKQYIKKLEHIPQMAQATMKMVTKSVDAFVKKDLHLAQEVIACDDTVDKLFIVIKQELIELITKNRDNGEQAIDLIMIAKYFERIGDHATNVAEWVVFLLTGLHKDSNIMG
ncbi:MAG: phosphate signaling complex protein PhoU [Clostridiales bacterium]|nr:phosphate signaling complex protein PhoU [Clostridiales bacterium]